MCKDCPHRAECIGKSRTQAKRLMVSTSTAFFYEKSQEQKTPEFLEKCKKRSSQKWKNGEMKRFHGMSRARGWGLRSILFQAKLTAKYFCQNCSPAMSFDNRKDPPSLKAALLQWQDSSHKLTVRRQGYHRHIFALFIFITI